MGYLPTPLVFTKPFYISLVTPLMYLMVLQLDLQLVTSDSESTLFHRDPSPSASVNLMGGPIKLPQLSIVGLTTT